MNKIKINVWQIGYTTFKDYLMDNKQKALLHPMGYVLLESEDDWAEKTWDLLNWSCWTETKPENVHSPLNHCNSDIIVNVDGTDIYMYAKSFGWGEEHSLFAAETAAKKESTCTFWPFQEVKRTSGPVRIDNDKVYQKINGKEVEITW